MLAPGSVPRPAVPGPKVLLMGHPGDGKTSAIRTVLASGLKVFIQFTEPGMEVLLDPRRGKVYSCDEGLHWHYTPPMSPSWQDLTDVAKLVEQFDYKAISDMKSGFKKDKFNQFFQFLNSHVNLTCDRCGKQFGPVENLQPYNEWCFVEDSLSSLSITALRLVIGGKPTAHEGEWGEAMTMLEMYVNKFAYDIPCMGIMTSHIEVEGNQLTGGQSKMAATIGRKLAPKIPRPFSDVIHAYREKDQFFWSTTTPDMLLKTRHLKLDNKIAPDFKPIIESWREATRLGVVPDTKSAPLPPK